MKTLLNLILLTIIVSITCSCCKPKEKDREGTINTNGYEIVHIFTVDGCKMYRFYDKGKERYFSTCPGAVGWSEVINKKNINLSIPTVKKDTIFLTDTLSSEF